MSRLPRLALAILIAATLLSTAALASPLPGAGPRRPAATASAPLDLFSQLWSFLTGFWTKNGCGADPNGLRTTTPTPTSENGCGADPDGLCLSGSTTDTSDNGCGADPSGHCGG